jgi:hypothetical protein
VNGELGEAVRSYAERTRESSYTLALVVPFLVIYEVGLIALRLTHLDFRARNGADAIIRFMLFPLGLQRAGTAGAVLWSVVSMIVLAACYAVWRSREGERRQFRPRLVGWLYAESVGWAAILFVASLLIFSSSLRAQALDAGGQAAETSVAAQLVFNAGAGVYEELVFRVLLVLVLVLFFTRIVHLERLQGGIAAAAAAALLFSLVHFGSRPGADPWGGEHFLKLFAFRWAAGGFFSLLFYFRSFGIAVATHAIYDTMVTVTAAFG